ncbi:MAG: MBL fold metallo-hydrolase [Clostridia bacterium]|nr:MBL fold metallo-hydrolase [Clostridia bacterium]
MKELFADTWVQTDRGVRIFLLAGKERALVIDTGMTGLDIRAMAAAQTDLPFELLNTHADRDHIASNAQFPSFYMHPAEAAFYHNVQHGRGRILPVFDGDVIDLGARELEILHLPGHTPGSITVLDRRSRCLIGGDPIQADGDIYMFGPQRDFEAYIASLRRLARREDFDAIYPSHAAEKVSRDVIAPLIDGAGRILAGEVPGTAEERHGQRIRVCDVGVARFLCPADAI